MKPRLGNLATIMGQMGDCNKGDRSNRPRLGKKGVNETRPEVSRGLDFGDGLLERMAGGVRKERGGG